MLDLFHVKIGDIWWRQIVPLYKVLCCLTHMVSVVTCKYNNPQCFWSWKVESRLTQLVGGRDSVATQMFHPHLGCSWALLFWLGTCMCQWPDWSTRANSSFHAPVTFCTLPSGSQTHQSLFDLEGLCICWCLVWNQSSFTHYWLLVILMASREMSSPLGGGPVPQNVK